MRRRCCIQADCSVPSHSSAITKGHHHKLHHTDIIQKNSTRKRCTWTTLALILTFVIDSHVLHVSALILLFSRPQYYQVITMTADPCINLICQLHRTCSIMLDRAMLCSCTLVSWVSAGHARLPVWTQLT